MNIIKGFTAASNHLYGPSPIVPSGNVATIGLQFLLSEEWDDLTVSLVIHKCGLTYQQTLDADGTVAIPAGVMESTGSFELALAGYTMDGEQLVQRMSTNRISGRVIDGAYVAGMTPAPGHDDPSDWERMLDHLVDYLNPHQVTAEQVGAYTKAEVYTKEDVYTKAEAGALIDARIPMLNGTAFDNLYVAGNLHVVDIGAEKEIEIDPFDWKITFDRPGTISGLADPTNDDDAATKKYVDDQIAEVPGVVVDTEMSDVSANAVENKVIKAYVDEKRAEEQIGIELPIPSNPFGLKLYDCGAGSWKVNKHYSDFYKAAVAGITWTSYYLNPETGNDNNDGLTPATAFKTIGKAISQDAGSIRVVLPIGQYNAFNTGIYASIQNKSKNILIECPDGVYDQRFGILASSRTFTDAGSGVWQNAITTAPVSVSKTGFLYTAAESLAACTATAGTYYHDGSKVYIHTTDGLRPMTEFLEYNNNITIYEQNNSAVFAMRNVRLSNGDRTALAQNIYHTAAGNRATSAKSFFENVSTRQLSYGIVQGIYAKNCVIQGDPDGNVNAMPISNNTTAWLENCVILSSGADGYNYHNTGKTGAPCAVELNCVSKDAGMAHTKTLNNCTTAHENWTVIRIGGNYMRSRDRAVHDGHTAVSYNAFCNVVQAARTGNTTFDFAVGIESTDTAKMYIYKCGVGGSRSTYNVGVYAGTANSVKLFGTPADRVDTSEQIDLDWDPFAEVF